jgi:hypothetical protein
MTGNEPERDAGMSRDVLVDLAALGPFFSVDAHLPAEHPQPPWLEVGDLTSQPELTRGRIAAVRHALAAPGGSPAGQVEARVAASAAHFGMVARLASPALAALAFGFQLSTQPCEMWWQDVLGGPFPLSVPAPVHRLDPGQRSAETACRKLVCDVLEPVTSTIAELMPLSLRVLWGNVASAVNSAILQIAAKRPAAADAAQNLAEIVFAAPQLRSERNAPGPAFRRSSCCLIYRLSAEPGRGTCGDCVLSSSGGAC